MSHKKPTLTKNLSLSQAIGLAITMVVGSGLLILPGIAYEQAGNATVYAWIISAIAIIPILIVFAKLGSMYPSAGGVAGFIRNVFSERLGIATEVLVLSTIPGGAGIAITGGKYFSSILGGDPRWVVCGTILVFIIGGFVNYMGVRISGRVQQLLAFSLVFVLLCISLSALIFGDKSVGVGIAPVSHFYMSIPTVGLILFAFVGWELMSFTSEEFKNPERDFPLMIYTSFILVVVMYLLIAISIQLILSPHNPHLSTDPISELLSVVSGGISGKFISVLGFVNVCANFISVTWAMSRMIFSSAREGILPKFLSGVNNSSRTPKYAVTVALCLFAVFVTLYFLHVLGLVSLFKTASISFFFSYILSVLAYIKISQSTMSRLFGIATLGFVMVVFFSFGLGMFYPFVMFIIGYVMSIKRIRYSPIKNTSSS